MKSCPRCNLKYPSHIRSCFIDGAALADIPDPRIGTTIGGRYLIESVAGEGGMATVYKARHRLVDRPCAVKIMSAGFARNEVIRERFRREATAAQKLAHPNIIEIFDQGDAGEGSLYLVMELLDGGSLADVLDQGPVPLDRALPLLIQTARGLARAHDLEVVHRDLKPENIFVAPQPDGSDLVKILDFGIARSMTDARLTGTGEVFGTPQYMAPERITSIDAGPPSDLYAVGVIMFEMLTGRQPFEAEDIATYFKSHLKEPPPKPRSFDPSIPQVVEDLILELLAKDPKDRPVDAHRLLADLVDIAGAIGARVPPDPTIEPASSRAPAKTLPPIALDRWAQRTSIFEQMLARAYPNGQPGEASGQLERIKALVREIGELRRRSIDAQHALEGVERRSLDCRQRFGNAVDALGLDVSRGRDQLKSALAASTVLAVEAGRFAGQLRKSHQNLVFWEGRSGFQEPYAELADAYRAAAAIVDAWVAFRATEAKAKERVAAKRSEVKDLEFQVHELRGALGAQLEAIEEEKSVCQAQIGEMGQRADELDHELLELATNFCEPLRRLPALKPLFTELESDAAS